jgi:EAL domain-containing protein (putative c-di-GMP-specific phosphodiesterase class I)
VGSVLIVDDEPNIARLIERILEREHHQVQVATDAEHARQAIEEKPFDLVLCDMNLSQASGLELLRYAKQQQPDVAVMLITGGPTMASAIAAIDLGALRYLTKPFAAKDIIDAVRFGVETAENKRAQRVSAALGQRMIEQERVLDSLGTRFNQALDTLWMAYQPIVCRSQHRSLAFEALVRNCEATLLRPEELLTAAASLSLEHRLGRSIRAACAKLPAGFPDSTDLFVNIQACDLRDEELYDSSSPLSLIAKRVVLEITERAHLDDFEDVQDRLDRLRKLGFRIAIDDLGAGYSGLTSFASLKPDIVKLDMSLVRDVHLRPPTARIVRSMVELSRDLGVKLICEGIENRGELEKLVELECDLFQGYFFARPSAIPPLPQWGDEAA